MSSAQVEDWLPSGPTALRMLLGAHLRRLREAAGVSREAAGYELRASESKISRMELGRVTLKERDVADLLARYGITDDRERDATLTLVRRANAPGWWHRYNDILPASFQSYLGLEAIAEQIRTYEVQFVPGLLQTRAYARAVISLHHVEADEIERRVDLRMARQQAFFRPGGPQLWAVLDEALLRRPMGSVDVMREQIGHLAEATELSNVTIQVVPFYAGGHAAAGGAFTMLRFPYDDLPDVVYMEQLSGALYLDRRDDVELHTAALDRLLVEAEPPSRTAEILNRLLHDLQGRAVAGSVDH